jgi:spermidine synthase
MADSEPEMRDHYEAVARARGRVLINGLGLGMVLSAILAKPDVEHVTVVEVEPDVIALVGPHYACDRLQIVCTSAFDYEPPAPMSARYRTILWARPMTYGRR